jgi:molybdenum cofactor synthesis domain-containing protein
MVRGIGFKSRTNVDSAIQKMVSAIDILESVSVSVYDCYSHVLAEDVVSPLDIPPFDRAAMDGFAVRASDTFGASLSNPILLRKSGKIGIGESPDIAVNEGEAVMIATGAAMPAGADAVVMVEYTRNAGEYVEILKSVTPGKNVSLRGEDIREGEIVLRKGEILQPQDAGVLASLGFRKVTVYRKPVIAVISTGNELVNLEEKLEYGKIYNSNNPMICNAVKDEGFKAVSLGIARDSIGDIEDKLLKALKYDVVIFTGGTSVGESDLVPEVIDRYGKVIFHGVAMKPGMPTGGGVVDGKPVFMLPGSPSAALLGFYIIALPVLYALNGVKIVARKWSTVSGILEARVPSEVGIRTNARVRWENGRIIPIRTSGSGILTSFVRANALLTVPEEREGFEEGEKVEVTLVRDITEPLEV